jgi:hypothetical protein
MNEGLAEDEHDYRFVGRVGLFCPIKAGCGGGIMYRKVKGTDIDVDPDRYYSVTGTKGYRWLEAEYVKLAGKEIDIDRTYYDELVNDAIATIGKFGDVEWFRSEDGVEPLSVFMNMPMSTDDEVPWEG